MIPIKEQLKLWVKAGARCEFRGCNELLYKDNLTLKETNYAEIAHIVGALKTGPRGTFPLHMNKRHLCDNLMLLCKNHHKLVDSIEHEHEYPVELLRGFKSEHEERIRRLTNILPEHKTTIIRLQSKIGGDEAQIENGDIYKAINPRYPEDDKGLEIDLTQISGTDTKNYWQTGSNTIENKIESFFRPGINGQSTSHVSIFAFGPIPFLMKLGHTIGSKIPYEIYQKDRIKKDWSWIKTGRTVKYTSQCISKKETGEKVALLLSISGSINIEDIPASILTNMSIYEITVNSCAPSPILIRKKDDLIEFQKKFFSFLNRVRKNHPGIKEIHLFPAIPVSIAVLCGIERLPKIHPAFVIYDYNNEKGGFNKTITLRKK
ncbi:MAG: SAVED domain-containing protein [Bacteroidetes bacterium]|nr:SAVED domain-containing protein [Bacteroidota bacterium]